MSGWPSRLEPLAEHEVDGEALLGRFGVGALALERREVRRRIVAAVGDAVEPLARRREAGGARGGVGVDARGGGGIARILERDAPRRSAMAMASGRVAGGGEPRL